MFIRDEKAFSAWKWALGDAGLTTFWSWIWRQAIIWHSMEYSKINTDQKYYYFCKLTLRFYEMVLNWTLFAWNLVRPRVWMRLQVMETAIFLGWHATRSDRSGYLSESKKWLQPFLAKAVSAVVEVAEVYIELISSWAVFKVKSKGLPVNMIRAYPKYLHA